MKTITIFILLFLFTPENPELYICDNQTSEVYHLDQNCEALKRCTHEVNQITRGKAKELERRLCGFEI